MSHLDPRGIQCVLGEQRTEGVNPGACLVLNCFLQNNACKRRQILLAFNHTAL